MQTEQSVDKKLDDLAEEIAASFYGFQFTLEELGIDKEEYLDGAPSYFMDGAYALSESVFGSSYGPPAGIILHDYLCENGEDCEDDECICGKSYDLCDELDNLVTHYIFKRYPEALDAYSYWEDNELFIIVVLNDIEENKNE